MNHDKEKESSNLGVQNIQNRKTKGNHIDHDLKSLS